MLSDNLDKILQEEIDINQAVGTYCMAFYDNELVYEGAHGKDNLENDKKLDRKSIFKMFSMTKPITAVAVNILIERGLIKREDQASKYIPEFAASSVIDANGVVSPANNTVTIEHLLTMTSGMEYPNDFTKAGLELGSKLFWPLENGYPDKMIPTLELMKEAAKMPLLYNPGANWNYSLGADVLGAIVEIVSGQRYSDFLKENIFEPLGMVDTDFWVPADKLDRLVTMHDKKDDKYIPWDYPFLGTFSRKYKPEFESGGAGLVSTPEDYSKFALMLLNEGTLPAKFSKTGKDVKILSAETVRSFTKGALTKEQLSTANWDSMVGYNYNNIMRVLEDPDKAELKGPKVGEFGWDGWAGTYFSVDIESKVAFLYFINVTNGSRDWRMKQLKNQLYKDLFK